MIFQGNNMRCYFRWRCDDKIAMILPFPREKLRLSNLATKNRFKSNKNFAKNGFCKKSVVEMKTFFDLGQFQQHFTHCFCASKFMPILLAHGVECTAQKLSVYLTVHTSKVGRIFVGETTAPKIDYWPIYALCQTVGEIDS